MKPRYQKFVRLKKQFTECCACGRYADIDKPTHLCVECWRVVVLAKAAK